MVQHHHHDAWVRDARDYLQPGASDQSPGVLQSLYSMSPSARSQSSSLAGASPSMAAAAAKALPTAALIPTGTAQGPSAPAPSTVCVVSRFSAQVTDRPGVEPAVSSPVAPAAAAPPPTSASP